MDRIKQAIQSLLDELGDGWTVAQVCGGHGA